MRASRALALPLAAVAAGGALRGELSAYTLRRVEVPVLSPGSSPVRVLHVSDLHLGAGATPVQCGRARFLRELARLVPDLVVATGDFATGAAAYDAVVRAHEPLFAFPGVFVPGNNDYHAPVPGNPFGYLLPGDRVHRGRGARLPWPRLSAALEASGWRDLTHRRLSLRVGGRDVDARGVDDACLHRDDYDRVAGPADPHRLSLGVLHTPAPPLLDRFAADGVRLLFAGHTHGGQVRLPGLGAVVTNCGLDRARARGLSRWDGAYLHVSAGLGTSPYAPVRLFCRPEATLLTLTSGA